jgi:hypothetical protein
MAQAHWSLLGPFARSAEWLAAALRQWCPSKFRDTLPQPLKRCKSLNRHASYLTRRKKRRPPDCRSNARPAGLSRRPGEFASDKRRKELHRGRQARLRGVRTRICRLGRGSGIASPRLHGLAILRCCYFGATCWRATPLRIGIQPAAVTISSSFSPFAWKGSILVGGHVRDQSVDHCFFSCPIGANLAPTAYRARLLKMADRCRNFQPLGVQVMVFLAAGSVLFGALCVSPARLGLASHF